MKWTTVLIALTLVTGLFRGAEAAEPPIKVLLIDGQNNHNWRATTPVLKAILEEPGIFSVDVATAPEDIKDIGEFRPDFAKYDVLVSNYNGADWSEETSKAFVDYVRSGGGFVSVHAADNSFPNWKEYNEMIEFLFIRSGKYRSE